MKKLFLLLTLIATSVQAGILVEPYLGFGFTSGDYDTADVSTTGTTMGARLGYQFLGIMGGLDYSLSPESSWDFEEDGDTTTYKLKKSQFGVFAGYNLPILLRAWVGYNFSAKADGTYKSKDLSYEGSTTTLGVGFTGLPFVSLNLEYKMSSFDDNKYDGDKLDEKLEVNEVLLSVSLPLDL